MKNKTLTLEIAGREAIPVRAIPYVTNWKLAPDELARRLAKREKPDFEGPLNLAAYYLVGGKPQATKHRDWVGVSNSLEAFKANLREKYPNPDAYDARGADAWQQESPLQLPVGVFVWRKDFEDALRADFVANKPSYVDEQEWMRDLTYTPMLAADVRDMVMAGFPINAMDAGIPVQTGIPQNAAEIHENRYRAVGEYAQSASFDVAELDAWAVANRVPGSFRTLLTPDSIGADLPSVRRFQPCPSLLVLIASAFVPAEMEPHEAREKLLEAGDTGECPNAVSRLRDLIMGRYERLLLNAVFDGELDLYDTLTYTKIDVAAARLRYAANPESFMQAAPAQPIDTVRGPVTDADIADFAPRPVRLPNASRVNVEWLVREIAFALVEIPDDERLATLKKETPDGPGKWNIEPLTGDDWRLIREICGSNPPAPSSPAQFAAWRTPFDTAPNRPDWGLRPEFKPSNEMQAAQSRWSLCSVQHLRQIRQKVERKELSLITPAGIETSDIYDNAGLIVGCLRIADAKAYLDQCCIAWEVAIPDVAPPAPDRSEPAIPIESLFAQPGFERNYQMLVTEPGSSPIKTAITGALIASAKAGETLAASIRTVTRKGEKWSNASLLTLLEESKMPGFTQKAAAEKYGVTPQRISALLKQAKDKFETPAKTSFFPTAGTQIRRVKGKQYK